MWSRDNISCGSNCQSNIVLLLALFVLVILFTSGCRPMKEISIEVLKPAKITLPGEIERIAFMNRSYQPFLARASKDTASRSPIELYVIDTIFQNNHFMGVFETMSNELVFNVEDKHILLLRRRDTTRFPEALTPQQILNITDKSLTDALISLEGYQLKDTAYYYISYIDGYYHVAFGILGEIIWRIYDVQTGTVLDEYTVYDTIIWDVYGNSVTEATANLPQVTDSYREISKQTGKKYGLRLTPEWFNEPRYFYSGPGSMGYASKQIAEDDWEEALEVWQELARLKRKRLAARAAFNIALYYEMEDRLVPALDWAKKSNELHDDDLTDEYIKLLDKRIKDRLKLQQQIPPE